MKVVLPITDNASIANVCMTVTPYKLLVLICWHKPLEGLQWVYTEKDIEPGNDFETLFSRKNNADNNIADIDITVTPQVINQISEVRLGYKNIALELKKKL
jgi:hypothetical protein